jgi:hypothetical protein
MAVAAIFKAVDHFWFRIFDLNGESRTYLSTFIGIRRKLTELLQFEFFIMAAAAILALVIGDL